MQCDICKKDFNPDDLNTRDIEQYGEHTTIEVCDRCKDDPVLCPYCGLLNCACSELDIDPDFGDK